MKNKIKYSKREIEEKFGQYLKNLYDVEDAAEFYAACLAILLNFTEEDLAKSFLYSPSFLKKISLVELNALMHYVHEKFPGARREAVFLTSSVLSSIKEDEYGKTFTIFDLEIFIEKFPESLKQEIESLFQEFAYNADLELKYSSTWFYSHLEEGDDYIYKDNEHPVVYVYGVSKKTLEIFSKKLERFLREEKGFNELEVIDEV